MYIVNEKFVMLSESRFFENAVFQIKVDTLGVQEMFKKQEHLDFTMTIEEFQFMVHLTVCQRFGNCFTCRN